MALEKAILVDGPVSEAVRGEAERLARVADVMLAPAPRDLTRDWLLRLGLLVAGNLSVADSKARIAAYCDDLRYPALCFTDESRRRAGVAFKFFPTFSELSSFLDAEAQPMRKRAAELRAVAGRPVAAPTRRWSDLTVAEKQAHEDQMTALKAALASATPKGWA